MRIEALSTIVVASDNDVVSYVPPTKMQVLTSAETGSLGTQDAHINPFHPTFVIRGFPPCDKNKSQGWGTESLGIDYFLRRVSSSSFCLSCSSFWPASPSLPSDVRRW